MRALGYRESEIAEIEAYAVGHATLSNAPAINTAILARQGFTDEKLAVVEKSLAGAFDIKFVFNKWTLGADFLTGALKVPASAIDDKNFDLLTHLGFSRAGDRGRQCAYLRRDDAGGRAASSSPNITPCSTAPIPAGAPASAISRSSCISA